MSLGGLFLPALSGNYASTPDNAVLDIVGDIDLRVDVTLDTWTPAANVSLVTKWGAGGVRSYLLQLGTDGRLALVWSTDGTATLAATATVPVPVMQKPGQFSPSSYRAPQKARLAVRATLDVDNGAAGKSAQFWTAPSLNGPWTQLGDVVTTGGTTAIFSGAAEVEVGGHTNGTLDLYSGTVHAVEIRSGIDGTAVANPKFWKQPTGTTSFADGAGRTWTVNSTNVATPAKITFGTPSYGLPFQVAADNPCSIDESFCAARDLIAAEMAVNAGVIARTSPARPCAIMTLTTPVVLPALSSAAAMLPLSFDTIEFDNDRMIDFDRSNQFIRPSRPGIYEVVAWAAVGAGVFNEEVDFYVMTGFSGPNLFGTGGGGFSALAQDSYLVGGSVVWFKTNVLLVFDTPSLTDVRVPGWGLFFDGNTTTANQVTAARLAVYWKRDEP